MAKSVRKSVGLPKPPVNRVRIRFLWRLMEIEGEGLLPVVGGLVIALLLVGWLIVN